MMTLEQLKNEIYSYEKPKEWREGQFVFNMVDELYGVARIVQFHENVDCFHNDSKIGKFLELSLKYINDYE